MVRMPVRMNEATVTIETLSQGKTTVQDPDFRETVAIRNYAPKVTVKGQLVGARQWFKLNRTMTGDSNPSDGVFLFRPEVLAQAGITLAKGDRVTMVNNVTVDFTFIHVAPLSPYRGRFLMTVGEFRETQKLHESM